MKSKNADRPEFASLVKVPRRFRAGMSEPAGPKACRWDEFPARADGRSESRFVVDVGPEST